MSEHEFHSDSNAEPASRGSAWAELDEQFFEMVDGLFSVGFTALADSMLGTHDNDTPAAERAAAMRRHPSARRRF